MLVILKRCLCTCNFKDVLVYLSFKEVPGYLSI